MPFTEISSTTTSLPIKVPDDGTPLPLPASGHSLVFFRAPDSGVVIIDTPRPAELAFDGTPGFPIPDVNVALTASSDLSWAGLAGRMARRSCCLLVTRSGSGVRLRRLAYDSEDRYDLPPDWPVRRVMLDTAGFEYTVVVEQPHPAPSTHDYEVVVQTSAYVWLEQVGSPARLIAGTLHRVYREGTMMARDSREVINTFHALVFQLPYSTEDDLAGLQELAGELEWLSENESLIPCRISNSNDGTMGRIKLTILSAGNEQALSA